MSDAREERALSETTAFIMTSMMSDVINAGTAWQAREVGFTLPAAGKTGTTNDYHDAWFVGFTPHLVAGVWIGYDHAEDDHRQRLCRRACGAAVGTLHGGRYAGGRPGSVRHAGNSSSP